MKSNIIINHELILFCLAWVSSKLFAMSYVGIVAGMWPCGTISFVDELFRSESKAQVYGSLHTYFYTNPVSTKDISKIHATNIITIRSYSYMFVGFLCYDDACHLKRFATNPQRSTLTDVATVISGLNIVVDKMHFAGHIDPWCHANCNPHNFDELKEVKYSIYNKYVDLPYH